MAGWAELSCPKLDFESKKGLGINTTDLLKKPQCNDVNAEDDADVLSACVTAPLSPGAKDLLREDVLYPCTPPGEPHDVMPSEVVLNALAELRLEHACQAEQSRPCNSDTGSETSTSNTDTASESDVQCGRFWEELLDRETRPSSLLKKRARFLPYNREHRETSPPKQMCFRRPMKRKGLTRFGLGWELAQPLHPVYVLLQIQRLLTSSVQCVELDSSNLQLCGVYEVQSEDAHGVCRFRIQVLGSAGTERRTDEGLWVQCSRTGGDTFAYHSLLGALGTHFDDVSERLPLVAKP